HGFRVLGLLPAEVAGTHAATLTGEAWRVPERDTGRNVREPGTTVTYRAPRNTRDQVEGGASSVSAGQGQTRLPRGLLGLAAQPPGCRRLAAPTQLLRLSQARGHLR